MKKYFLLSLILLCSCVAIFPQNTVLINELLNLPVPPPPNPLALKPEEAHINKSNPFDPLNPPADDAPISLLMSYWSYYGSPENEKLERDSTRVLFRPKPSEKTLERIKNEIERAPEQLVSFLRILGEREEDVNFVKELYDKELTERKLGYYWRKTVKDWLVLNSPYFLNELLLKVQKEFETEKDYLFGGQAIFALAKFDWEKAKPFLERALADDQNLRVQIVAKAVFYKHALDEKDESEIERWRKELMSVVENKAQEEHIRDLALQWIILNGDFPGRDEWYFRLFEDETLHKLSSHLDQSYLGFEGVPLILSSPQGKYKKKLLKFLGSENKAVRTAAVDALLTEAYRSRDMEIIQALLPLLVKPNWINNQNRSKESLIELLGQVKVPESVPGLIKVLEMRKEIKDDEEDRPPSTSSVLSALAFQADARAVPALKEFLQESNENGFVVEAVETVSALLACGGYSATEQAEAIESTVKKFIKERGSSHQNLKSILSYVKQRLLALSDPQGEEAEDIKGIIASQIYLRHSYREEEQDQEYQVEYEPVEVGQDLVNEMIFRIKRLRKSEPEVASVMRSILLEWKGQAVNSLLLSELKENKIEIEGILRLLIERKSIRENQINELFSARSSHSLAFGISSCLLEDENSYKAVFSTGDDEAKASFLACARMIRLKIPVDEVGKFLKSENKLLADAAFKYLESEDSAEARNLIYSAYPNQAIILGARKYFGKPAYRNKELIDRFFESVYGFVYYTRYYSDESDKQLDKVEQELREEILQQEDLIGIYYYDKYYVRIYKDKVIFSLERNEDVYYERELKPEEFKRLTYYLAETKASELPPFLLGCGRTGETPPECMNSKEFVMVGKNGGRRVYRIGEGIPEFFKGLEDIFNDYRKEPDQLLYRMQSGVAGLKVLFSSNNDEILTVWKRDDDIRLLVVSGERYRELEKQLEDKIEKAKARGASNEEITRIQFSFNKLSGVSWMRLRNGKLEKTEEPSDFNNQWKASAGSVKLEPSQVNGYIRDLYKVTGETKVKLGDGNFYDVVISSDGKWALAKKSGSPVRIDVLNGKIYPMEFAEQDEDENEINSELESFWSLLVYVPSLEKFLAAEERRSSIGCEDCYEVEDFKYPSGSPQYYEEQGMTTLKFYRRFFLVTPSTGEIQPVGKEIGPLAEQTFRPLQPVSGKPDEFWVAKYDRKTRTTHIGIFNAKTLKFRSLVSIPRIKFNSMKMWVDEKEKKIYIAHAGSLLSVPMP